MRGDREGLLDSTKWANFIITDLGRQTLAKKPDRIDTAFIFDNADVKHQLLADKQIKTALNIVNPEKSSLTWNTI